MDICNVINEFDPIRILIMPMLGKKPDEYPRFRDCYVTKENNIAICTRVGGDNRNCGFGEEELYNDSNFIRTYDDEFDDTYGIYEFSVPNEWKEDFNKIMKDKLHEVSNKYKKLVIDFYPNEAGKIWNNKKLKSQVV